MYYMKTVIFLLSWNRQKDKIVYEKAWLNLINFKVWFSKIVLYTLLRTQHKWKEMFIIYLTEKRQVFFILKKSLTVNLKGHNLVDQWSKYTWRQFRKYSWLINICRDANFNGHQGNTEHHIFMLSNRLRLKVWK